MSRRDLLPIGVISSKKRKRIDYLVDDGIKKELLVKIFTTYGDSNRHGRSYFKAVKKLKRLNKVSDRKNWSVKKHNRRVITLLLDISKSKSRKKTKEIAILVNIFWIGSKKIKKVKEIKIWLNEIDFLNNGILLYQLMGLNEIKVLLKSNKVSKKALLSFSKINRYEAMLHDLCALLVRKIYKRID